MDKSSRRRFLGGTAAACLLQFRRTAGGHPLGLPAGCQIYPVRKELVADFEGTLKTLHTAGYRVIEFCSPPGYVKAGLGPLVDMKAAELRRRVEEAGLRVVSCHYQFQELKQHIDARIAFAGQLGLKQMVVASVGRPKTLDGWREAADGLNQLGEKTRQAGIQLGFHNHNQEFERIDGVLVFDELMKRFDPKLVKSQFQVSVISAGVDPVEVLEKYPGRFLSLHLQDWSAASKQQVPIGQGSIDWKKLFAAAGRSAIQYYFVEMNMDALKASYPFLKTLEV